MHAGLHVKSLPSKVGLSLFKGEESLLCCLMGRLKVNQYEEEKKAFHVLNTGCACVFPTGGTIMCPSPEERHDISLTPVMQALVELRLPDLESSVALAWMESQFADTRTHSGTLRNE